MGVVKYLCLVIVVQITQTVYGRYAFTKHRFSPDFPTLHGKSLPVPEAQDLDLFTSGMLEPQTHTRPSYGHQINPSFNEIDILNQLSNYIGHNNYEHNPVDLHSLKVSPTHSVRPADLNIATQTNPTARDTDSEDNTAFTDILIDTEIENIAGNSSDNDNSILKPFNLQNLYNKQAQRGFSPRTPNIQSNLIHNKVKSPIANTNNNHNVNGNRIIHPRTENSRYDPESIMHYSAYPGKVENELTDNPAASKIFNQQNQRYKSTAQPKESPHFPTVHELFPFDAQPDTYLENFDDDELNEYLTTDSTKDVNNDFEVLPDYLFKDLETHQPTNNRNNIQSNSALQPRLEKSIMHYPSSRYSSSSTNYEPDLIQSNLLQIPTEISPTLQNLSPNIQHELGSLDTTLDLNYPGFGIFDDSLLDSDEPFNDLDDYYNLFKDTFKSDREVNSDLSGSNDESEKASDQSVKSLCLPQYLYQNIANLPPEIIDVSAIIKNGQSKSKDMNQLFKVLLLSQLFSKDGNNFESLKSLLPFLCLS